MPQAAVARPATRPTVAPRYSHIRRQYWRGDQPFLVTVFLDERLRAKVTADLRRKIAVKIAAPQLSLNAQVAHGTRAAGARRGMLISVVDGICRGEVVRIDIRLP